MTTDPTRESAPWRSSEWWLTGWRMLVSGPVLGALCVGIMLAPLWAALAWGWVRG